MRLLGKVLSILVAVVSILYIQTEIYNFEEPHSFSGDYFFNPYKKWDKDNTLKANFHAHTAAWGGTTNGENTPTQLIEAYKEKKYDIIGISNYFNINHDFDTSRFYIPLYEHGINIMKTHKQAINPEEVLYFDFPFFQNTSQKQQIINKLRDKGALVSINHPKFMDGHTTENLKYLQGYHFLEVLNHYRISDKYWDAALSSGKLSWILGNDDTHDLHGNGNTFVMWTMVKGATDKSEILDNMKAGKMYGMKGNNAALWNELSSCEITNDTLKIVFKTISDTLQLIGQNGKILKSITNSAEIYYPINMVESYIRCRINSKTNAIYLNPIVRFDGKVVPYNYFHFPETNVLLTWMYRLIIVLINFILIRLTFFGKNNKINPNTL